jgi:hypothetical protein
MGWIKLICDTRCWANDEMSVEAHNPLILILH